MLCFRKIPVARNSIEKRRGYQDFPSKVFCTTTPKTFAREPLCVVFQKTSGIEEDYALKGGLSRFSVERFLYHNAENFGKGTFLCFFSENFR